MPDLTCSCGFYAVKEADLLDDGYGMVALDVELSGRVIIAANGYRAGHQRVLRASVDGCHFCGEPVHAFAVGLIPDEIAASGYSTDTFSNVRPLCADHVRPEHDLVTPEIVMARLGIPFDVRAEATS